MQGSARKDVAFGPARMYTVAVPGPKRKSWLTLLTLAERKVRVRRQRRSIVAASLGSLMFLPVWAFLRIFYCWEDSCSGFQCLFCDLHWVITLLILTFMVALVWMAYELMKVSKESGQHLPETIGPGFPFWHPCTDRVSDPWLRSNRFRAAFTFGTPFAAAPAFECCPIVPFRRPQRAFWQHPSRADPRQPAYAGLSEPSALASRHR